MNNSPYIAYLDNRPIKIAYILNPRHQKFKKHLDAVISFNQTIWGGRYNPIILSERQTLKEEWWKILVEHDPDFIVCIPRISNAIISKIENHLSPIEVIAIESDIIERNNGLVSHLMPNPLPIMAVKQNVENLTPLFENPIYVEFNSIASKNTTLKRFINYNFGENRVFKMHTQNNPIPYMKRFKIDNVESLCMTLEELFDLRYESLIYPIQLSSIPNYLPNVESEPIYNRFTITVGDSAYDTTYHWNRCSRNSSDKRDSINDIWIPLILAKNTKFQSAMKKWLQTVVDIYSINAYQIQFVSFSLSSDELENIAKNFEIQGYSTSTRIYTNFQQPTYWKQTPFSNVSEIKDFYTSTNSEMNIFVKQPDINGNDVGGQWITELYIKLPTKYRNFIGMTYWLQLPRKNNFVDWLVEGKQTRINALGIPNTLLETNNSIIKIQIPYERTLLDKLFIQPNYPWSEYDLRHNKSIITTKYYRHKISDKGMYLESFINFFHDLSEAYMSLTISFWRYVYNKLSKGASRNHEYVRNRIQRQINRNGLTSFGNQQGLDLLVDIVLKEAEIVRQNEDIVKINNFTSYFVNEYKNSIGAISDQDKYYLDKEKIVKHLSELLSRNILLLGIRPVCPHCGSAFWYHINETKQHLICIGCQNDIKVSAEEEWYYKINNLFKISVIQGTIPVVMVIGQLLRNCRHSFFYFPSTTLFQKRRRNPVAEIDVVCIQDGKFIIGEVKNKQRNFNQPEFDKIEKIARKIKPDKVILSCMENQVPNRRINRLITNMQTNLSDLGIEVSWYKLDLH